MKQILLHLIKLLRIVFICYLFCIMGISTVKSQTPISSDLTYSSTGTFSDPIGDSMKHTVEEYDPSFTSFRETRFEKSSVDIKKVEYQFHRDIGDFEILVEFAGKVNYSNYLSVTIFFSFKINFEVVLSLYYFKHAYPDNLEEGYRIEIDDVSEQIRSYQNRVQFNKSASINDNILSIKIPIAEKVEREIVNLNTLFQVPIEKYTNPSGANLPSISMNIEERFNFVSYDWYSWYDDEIYLAENIQPTPGRYFRIYGTFLTIVLIIIIAYGNKEKISNYLSKLKSKN